MHVLHIHVTYKVVWKSEMVGRLYFLNILQCIYIYILTLFLIEVVIIFGDFA